MLDRRLAAAEDDEAGRLKPQSRYLTPPTDLRVAKLATLPVLVTPGGVAAAKLGTLPVLTAPGGMAVAKFVSRPLLTAPGSIAVAKLVSYLVVEDVTPPPYLPHQRTAQLRSIRADDSVDWQPIRPSYLRPVLRQPVQPPPPIGVSSVFHVPPECCFGFPLHVDPPAFRVAGDPVPLCVPRDQAWFRVPQARKQ